MVPVLISSPMKTSLYSVRMRASCQGRHIAGAERIVEGQAVAETTAALVERAMSSVQGQPDGVHCSSEQIDPATVSYAKLPDVTNYQVCDWQEGRLAASALLSSSGVSSLVAAQAVALLANGAGPDGTVMRGAVIMDALTGERLEKDPSRGVRVSRMDLVSERRPDVESLLATAGLNHHRVLEALLLAGKVLQAPGIIAELCWSDAPDYITGYVATPQSGYQRISDMKMVGDARGGRVFFVDLTNISLKELTDYLELQPVLFTAAGVISPLQKWKFENE